MNPQPFNGRLNAALIRGLEPKETDWSSIAYFLKIVLNPAFFYLLFRLSAVNFSGVADFSIVILTILLSIAFEYLYNEIFSLNPKHNQFGNDVFRHLPQNTYVFLLLSQLISTGIMLLGTTSVLHLFVVTAWLPFLGLTAAFILVKTILIVVYMWTNMQEFTSPY